MNRSCSVLSTDMTDDGTEPLTLEQVLIASFVDQCSVKFRSVQCSAADWRGTIFDIYAEDGVTYITHGESRKQNPEKYDSIIWISDTEGDIPELKQATEELQNFTERVNDIIVNDFSLQWGLKQDQLPSLLACGGTFKCSAEAEPFKHSLVAISLFIAIESSKMPQPGVCFAKKKSCSGFGYNVLREKIEIRRIKQMNEELKYDAADFVSYVRRRLIAVCPETVMTAVSVCRRCFDEYKNERIPAKRSSPSSPSSPLSPKRTGTSNGNYPRSQMSPSVWAVPKRQVASNRSIMPKARSPSGLMYVQDYSGVSTRRAAHVYKSLPFRPFLKDV